MNIKSITMEIRLFVHLWVGRKIDELIIFDWDDTLLKTIAHLREPLHRTIFDYVKEHLEPDITREEFDSQSETFYREFKSTILGWARKHNLSQSIEWEIHRLATPAMVKEVARNTIHNRSHLRRLRRLRKLGFTIVVLTHNSREFCLPLNEEFFDNFFKPEEIYDLLTVGHRKEVVDSYQHVLDDLDYMFEVVHMVDDTDRNLYCAKQLGMLTYHMLGEHPLSKEAEPYTDYACQNLDEFLAIMERRALAA